MTLWRRSGIAVAVVALAMARGASAQAPPPAAQPAAPPAALPQPPAPAALPPVSAAPQEKKWFDSVAFEAFVDAFGSLNYNFPRPQANSNLFRAFDTNNGFALAWAGLDVSYAAAPVGGTLALRFGPAADVFNGAGLKGSDASYGLANVRQAYATYKPVPQLAFDLGKFDAICGAEVADSHKNMNYTRGVLYWLGQPLFHTGLRATWQPIDQLSFKVMAVNGWNRSVDNNLGKTLGAQIGLIPHRRINAYVTYIGGPEQDETITCAEGTAYNGVTHTCDSSAAAAGGTFRNNRANRRWRHFTDLLVGVNPTDALSISLNGDLGYDRILDAQGREKNVQWMGAALATRYAFTERFAAALRGELYKDRDGFTSGAMNADGTPMDLLLRTATLTLEAKPSEWLIVRLDNRVDSANHDVFHKAVAGGATATQITTLLGVVVTTGRTWEHGH